MTDSPELPVLPLRHSGRFFDVLGLALKNAGLTLATLTLYRFWARTSMRRRLWSRVWFLEDPLEYTGTAWELVRGFFIALPCFFLPAIFVFYIAPYAMDPVGAAWLTAGFYVVVVPLMAAARYWMRRYQLAHTRWRGIRLGLAGSAWNYALASSVWTLAQTFSLGWFTPVARMNRARLLWSNTRFGNRAFHFVDDGEPPQQRLWWPFALGWFGLAASLVLATQLTFAGAAALADRGYIDPVELAGPLQQAGLLIVILALAGLFATLFWAPYNAAAMNRIASLISVDGARFRLRARSLSLFAVTAAGIAITVLSLGLLAPVAGFLQVRYVIARLELVGAPDFTRIGQSIVAEGQAGESLGDAFDLDMGVGVL